MTVIQLQILSVNIRSYCYSSFPFMCWLIIFTIFDANHTECQSVVGDVLQESSIDPYCDWRFAKGQKHRFLARYDKKSF